MSWCSCFLFCHPFPYSLGGGISSASEDADLPRKRWVFGKEFITWEISYREFWMRKRWVLYLHDYQPLALNHVLSRILQNHCLKKMFDFVQHLKNKSICYFSLYVFLCDIKLPCLFITIIYQQMIVIGENGIRQDWYFFVEK